MIRFIDEALQHYPFAGLTTPPNWQRVTIGDICADVRPGFASGKYNSGGSGVPHLRPMNINREGKIDLTVIRSVAQSNDIELKAGDILFNNTNSAELVGKTAVISLQESGFAFSNHMTRIRPESGINSVFIAKQLHLLWMSGYMRHRCTHHVNQASISSKTLANTIPILLPPTAEQTRIVNKLEKLLSELDTGIAELKAGHVKLQQYRQSLLKAAIEGSLTVEWRAENPSQETGAELIARILSERRSRWEAEQFAKFKEQGKMPPKGWQSNYLEPAAPDTSGLLELPPGWVWASVEQLGDVQLGRQRSPDKMIGDRLLPYIRAANITENGVDLTDVLKMDFSPDEQQRFALKVGDVLLTEASGSPEHVGRPAIWNHGAGVYCFQNTVLRFSPHGISSEFAFYSFLAMQKLGVFSKLSSGVGINHLSAGKFSKLPAPLPSTNEQLVIVQMVTQRLAACDEQDVVIEHTLRQSTVQRQNILRSAFEGQLVPQDPNDEPASVLLERINAERAIQPKWPKSRRTKSKNGVATMMRKITDVLAQAGDWMPAQEAFRHCGVDDGAQTEQIEALYAELRELDKTDRLAVESVTDAQGRKLYDRLKLVTAS